ncbi:hypothetical protein COOONC_21988 [Cooperia oncophora]
MTTSHLVMPVRRNHQIQTLQSTVAAYRTPVNARQQKIQFRAIARTTILRTTISSKYDTCQKHYHYRFPNGIIKAGPKNVPVIHTTAFFVELAIHVPPSVLQVEREVMQFTCNVVSTTLTGCYNCYKGAVALIDCTADVPQSTGTSNIMADPANAQDMENDDGEVPVEPGNDQGNDDNQSQNQEQADRPPIVDRQPVDEQRIQVDDEEIGAIHRKVQRILGRTDEVHSIHSRVTSTYNADGR